MSPGLPNTAPTVEPLFDGDSGSFPLHLRQLIVKLLRGPYLDGAVDAAGWQLLLDQREAISRYVAEIFLTISLDEDRKIAMLTPVQLEKAHTSPIAPRRGLKRDETLLALRLRLLLEQHAGSGTDAVISRSAMHDILAEHRTSSDRDDKRFAEACEAAISRLHTLRLVTSTELADEYRISPALAMALPITSIQDIPAHIAAIDNTEAQPVLPEESSNAELDDPADQVQE
ncbi:DUF4194 domain-containing protein [Glutamicibacter sp. MNS18]|uniref:DUF4194 domain-containing protein n=1 Tax=Glutamicibacter sp. MNS18 TaxID=2989817 RepID=UPI00223633E1|nr:DUF4194 domain-containing protein [Glutamicibacter sp. MNS18]MCW4466438.1 DUF4194 domain-containing protein [Glutamicibacter sp. MNS18]